MGLPRPPALRRRDRDRGLGQALTEFALVLTPLMLIFMGILQFGLLFSSQLGLINSTREGARYGATLYTDGTNASTSAAQVLCYTLGMDSSGAACSIGGVAQGGTLGRAMPGYNKANVCLTTGGVCGSAASTVGYCYYANPDGTTYSMRLNVSVAYRHPLIVPIISGLIDGIDGGTTDNALTATTSEQFRVEGPSLTSVPAGISRCTS
ncbi:MAG TPA: TadE family protein [Candidatus Limnocylindrales bacterium]